MWTRAAELGFVRPSRVRRAVERLSYVLGPEMIDPSIMEFRTRSAKVAARLLTEQMDALARARGKQFWVEKTPKHFQTVELIRRHVHTCIVVHVVRDGRAVLGSLRDRAIKFPERFAREMHPARGVSEWNRSLRRAWTQRYKRGVFIVRYEKFIKDPIRHLRPIMEAVDERYTEEMLAVETQNNLRREIEKWKQGLEEPIIYPEDKYDRLFSAEEKRWIVKHLDLRLLRHLDSVTLGANDP